MHSQGSVRLPWWTGFPILEPEVLMKSALGVLKILMIPFILTLYACQPQPDMEALRSEILALHKRMIDAH